MSRVVAGSIALFLTLGAAAAASTAPEREALPQVVFAGRVVDAATTAPVPGARITLAGTRQGATTGSDGRYRLTAPALSRGASATLVATRAGYQRAEQRVTATAELVETSFNLIPLAPGADEQLVEFMELEGSTVDLAAPAVQPQDFAGVGVVATEAAAPPPTAAMRSRGVVALGYGTGRGMAPGGGRWNTEEYDRIEEGTFVAASADPLSTFSIDVDRASYSNIRRFLAEGNAPPKDAVRIEEMLNYFTYRYPEPRGGEPFSITTEMAAAPWAPRHRLVRIGLHSQEVDTESLPASNLVFLVDVSGSMQTPDKLPLVKQSLRLLVNELREQDRVAIVVYAGAAGLVLPSTPGSEKTRIMGAIERLEAGGSTAGGAGLRLAYEVARASAIRGGNNRVVLATDGDFNVGVSSDAEMERLVEEKRRQGTFLTVLGYGTGNLKDAKMEKMADVGNGNYAYIDSLIEARKVLVKEMGGTLLTVAKDVKIQVEFNPARVAAYRLIGYENRALADHEFNDDTKDAGELGAGHSVTALYEIVPMGVESDVRVGGTDELRYQAPAAAAPRAGGGELAFVKVRYKEPTGETSKLLQQAIPDRALQAASADLTFAAAVAGFGMVLRDSEFKGNMTPERVLALARRGLGDDAEGYRADFVRMVERYRAVTRGEELTSAEW